MVVFLPIAMTLFLSPYHKVNPMEISPLMSRGGYKPARPLLSEPVGPFSLTDETDVKRGHRADVNEAGSRSVKEALTACTVRCSSGRLLSGQDVVGKCVFLPKPALIVFYNLCGHSTRCLLSAFLS